MLEPMSRVVVAGVATGAGGLGKLWERMSGVVVGVVATGSRVDGCAFQPTWKSPPLIGGPEEPPAPAEQAATIIAAAMPAIVLTVGFTTSLLRTGDRPRNALQKALSAPAPRLRIAAWRAGSGCGTCSRWADRRPMAPLRGARSARGSVFVRRPAPR